MVIGGDFLCRVSSLAFCIFIAFKKGEKKLVVTSGDRSDMLLAALETDTSGIILSNNILPKLLLTKDAPEKVALLGDLVKKGGVGQVITSGA